MIIIGEKINGSIPERLPQGAYRAEKNSVNTAIVNCLNFL
jgi:hypothetical protein